MFGLWVAPGFNDSEHYAAYLIQGGVQLPDREYYISDNEHMKEVRTKYQAHVSAMLKLTGFTDTDARAERIVALEHAIAEKHLTLAENDDIHKANNTWTQADFSSESSRAGLGGILSRRGTEQAGQLHRVAADGVCRRVGAGGVDSAGDVEGLAGVSHHRRVRAHSAEGSGR